MVVGICASRCGAGEIARDGIQRITVVVQLLLLVSVVLHVPVVVGLIQIPLVVLLPHAGEIGVLPQELTLQRIGTCDALGGVEDVAGVLLGRTELVLDALLINAGIACQVGLLCTQLILDLLLLELCRLVIVLELKVIRAVTKVLRQRVLVLLKLLVVGRSTECASLRKLGCRRWRCRVLVSVRDVRIGLVDHRL